MRHTARRAALVLAMGGVALAGCGSSSGTTGTTAPTTTIAPTTTTSRPTTTTTTGSASAARAAANVAVTDQIRAQLVAAGAALNSIPVAQYAGLAPGLTYLALDTTTGTYWAGARLVPAPSAPGTTTQAQVASQDDGSYDVFIQPRGGTWTAHATGASGPDTPCPVSVPAAVLAVWGWPSGSCRPAGT